MNVIATFKGGYGRGGTVWVETAECVICGEIKMCVLSDASEQEYNAAALCPECVKKACSKESL